ncbi:60S ribosomal protein L28 [Orobanche hederae]
MAAVTATVVRPVMAGVAVAKSQNFSRFPLKNSKTSSAIGSLASQFTGFRISTTHFLKTAPLPIYAPFRPSLQPVARRICPFTGKKSNKANKVSHSNHKTIRRQFVNLQYKRIWWEAGKRFLKLRLSTKAIKTIEKNGLDAVAKKAGIDLSKE